MKYRNLTRLHFESQIKATCSNSSQYWVVLITDFQSDLVRKAGHGVHNLYNQSETCNSKWVGVATYGECDAGS